MSQKLILTRISYFGNEIIIQTSDTIPCTRIENFGIEKIKCVGLASIDWKDMIMKWIGKDWIFHMSFISKDDLIFYLKPRDITKNTLDFWNETLGKRLSEVFEMEFKIVQ